METDNTVGQGRTITDPDTGRIYAIPEGGSDTGVSVGNEGGTVDSSGEGVQSGSEGSTEGTEGTQPSTSEGESQSSGQGFLEQYLRDVPEEHRPVVEPVLERMRQEQDRQFNQRFEQLREETRIPTTIYQSLIDAPLDTLDWIADRMQKERGLDIRADIKDRWYASQGLENPEQSGQGPNDQSGQDQDRPVTQAEIDRILEEREQQREQAQQQQIQEQQRVEQQTKTVNSWVDEAAGKFSLSLDDSQGEDPLRPVIIMQANALHEQGVAKGKAAVEMAVEAVSKRFGNQSSQDSQTNHPNLANGGTPPPARDFDVQDSKQRRARMEELMSPPPAS